MKLQGLFPPEESGFPARATQWPTQGDRQRHQNLGQNKRSGAQRFKTSSSLADGGQFRVPSIEDSRYESLLPIQRAALRKLASEGRADASEQFGLGERLIQEAHRPAFQRARPDLVTGKGGDEDEGDAKSIAGYARLKLQAAHYGHMHVRDYTGRDCGAPRAQKVSRGGKNLRVETQCFEEPSNRVAHRFIVVHNRNKRHFRSESSVTSPLKIATRRELAIGRMESQDTVTGGGDHTSVSSVQPQALIASLSEARRSERRAEAVDMSARPIMPRPLVALFVREDASEHF
jgi:hypothetical protein